MTMRTMGFDGLDPPEPLWQRALRLALTGGAHALVIGAVLAVSFEPRVIETPHKMQVRLLEPPPPPREVMADPPQPPPQKPRQVVRRIDTRPPPAPVMTAAANSLAPAEAFAVPPQPPPPDPRDFKPEPPAQPVRLPVTAARFDADYLDNPAPPYPAVSRRFGEQGNVVLQVRVTAEGAAASVEVRSGSGYPRLDEAALEAVRRWRFVPARRGDEPTASTVLVPIAFRLDQ